MNQAADWSRSITVLRRDAGFLCLELPLELCADGPVDRVERGLREHPAVTRCGVDRHRQQLTIHYLADAASAGEVARHLFSLLPGDCPPAAMAAPEAAALAAEEHVPGALPDFQWSIQPLLDRVRGLLIPPGTPPEGSLKARLQPVLESALTEKAIVNFFNDIVAFYLIKTHWELITRRWLQNPVLHRNAWLTTFYLVYLLVRYRKTK